MSHAVVDRWDIMPGCPSTLMMGRYHLVIRLLDVLKLANVDFKSKIQITQNKVIRLTSFKPELKDIAY